MNVFRSRLMPIIFLCFCANILCFLDRVNISIAAPFIMQQWGWDETQMGVVFSAFFVGYVVFMIPGGIMADRIGAYKTLTGGVAFWSLFTFLTPFFSGIGSMSFCRFLIGTGQGVNFSCISNFVADKIPLSHRAKVQAFTLSGVTIGSVLGLPLGSWIISAWGWPAIFYVFGLLGGVWIFFWLVAARCLKASITNGHKLSRIPIPWRRLIGHSSTIGLSGSYFCHNYSGYLFLVWLPTYLIQVHGLSLTATGFGAAVPFLASAIFMNVSGWLSDTMITRGLSREFSRKLLLLFGMGVSGCLLCCLPWIHGPLLVIGILTLSSAVRALSTPVYWTLSVDMAPRYAGILSAIMNTSGNLAGIAASALTGWIVSYYGTWNSAILLGGGITLLGTGIAAVFIRSSEILDTE